MKLAWTARQRILALALTAGLTIGAYLLLSWRVEGPGFPLDDAWIHQTYARNLALRGEWAFIPGKLSAGSTAPLWTVLLGVGQWLRQPVGWAYALGGVCLLGLAWIGERLFRRLAVRPAGSFPWMGVFLLTEWHLVWAAVSGMEILLYAVVIVSIFYLLSQTRPPWLVIGVLTGLMVWIRPDGLTILGPALVVLAWKIYQEGWHWRPLAQLGLGFVLCVAPYLWFNWSLSGNWWPNTFYAKQAEYAIRQQEPYLGRFVHLALLPWIGAGVLLLPGWLYLVYRAVRHRLVLPLVMLVWWLGYTAVYAWLLPVDYQHGRYMMPAMPVCYLLAGVGTAGLLDAIGNRGWGVHIARQVWATSLGVAAAAFLAIGAWTYAQDVAIIQTEMVRTALWIDQNTPPDALIAAHDIGAMGYYARREMVDLAGLVTPEVIPFIRSEPRLAAYMTARQVDYLVTFPGWYPEMTEDLEAVYRTDGHYAPAQGGENMAVFRWKGENQ
ncbi:MAG: hypothetical protein GYA17_04950 [Chloroflexi bacterium]|nr:hypothetical protein [Chloroflexota bacterium]